MVITAACLGLRLSELAALQWAGVDFQSLTVKVVRSFVRGEINPTKTEASESTLPLDGGLADALLVHRAKSACNSDSDFVFAGESGKVRWPDAILADYLKPAAVKAGVGNIGWHTFRHTYSTLLHSLGTTPAVQKKTAAPCRHSNNHERLYPSRLRRKAGCSFEGGHDLVRICTRRAECGRGK